MPNFIELSKGLFIDLEKVVIMEESVEDKARGRYYAKCFDCGGANKFFVAVLFQGDVTRYFYEEDAAVLCALSDQWRK